MTQINDIKTFEKLLSEKLGKAYQFLTDNTFNYISFTLSRILFNAELNSFDKTLRVNIKTEKHSYCFSFNYSKMFLVTAFDQMANKIVTDLSREEEKE